MQMPNLGFRTLLSIRSVFTPNQKKEAIKLLALALVAMVFEVLGIGLILPVTGALLGSPESSGSQLITQYLVNFLPQRDVGGHLFPVLLMLFILGLYLIKTIYMIWFIWRQQSFTYDLQAELSLRVFSGYLRQPYSYHLARNSSKLIQNSTIEVNQFVGLVQSLLMFVTEALVAFGLIGLLLFVEPLGMLLTFLLFASISVGAYYMSASHLSRLGQKRQNAEGSRLQHLQQALGGVKDIKVLGREDFFLERYDFFNRASARVSKIHQTLQQLPRLGLEFLTVLALTVLVSLMYSSDKTPQEIMPILALFGFAAFRLIPAFNRMMIMAQSMRFLWPSVVVIVRDAASVRGYLMTDSLAVPVQSAARDGIVFERVSFRYSGADKDTLSAVNLEMELGSVTGIIGPSGAGKSTLVNVLLGLLEPSKGSVRMNGSDIRVNLRAWQARIGYVPQEIYFTDETLMHNVAFGIADEKVDIESIWRALSAAQMADYVRALPNGLETKVGERGISLSGGQRQRLGIARALYHQPDVIVLDEATSALDIETEADVMKAVYALRVSKTVIIVSHRPSTISGCDRVIKVIDGHVSIETSIVGRMP